MPSGEFGLVTQRKDGVSSVATSATGLTWKHHDLGTKESPILNKTYFGARYGAFPNETTWYVTLGTFPTSASANDQGTSTTRLTQSVAVNPETTQFEIDLDKAERKVGRGSGAVDCSQDPHNCFSAAIAKTTDGGETWTVVYENVNKGDNIYPNGIHCISTTHCVAALEGDTARILMTTDGGQTWNETMHDPDPKSSLVSVRMISEEEVWVSGGHMAQLSFEGRFWHSLDGGKSWTKEAIPGLYTFSFDMISTTAGFAVALTIESGVQLLKYRPSNTTQGY